MTRKACRCMALLFGFFLAVPALAAEDTSVRVDGVTQGWIQGDSLHTSMGRENTIDGLEYHHLVSTPAGSSTQKHEVVIVTKRVDKATPKLWRAYGTRESLTVTIKFYRPNPNGDGTTQQHFTITLSGARIAGIETISPDVLNAGNSSYMSMERLRFEYSSITTTWVIDGGSYTTAVP